MQAIRHPATTPENDVLWRYPDMMTVQDLAEFMNTSYATAWKKMQELPWVPVGTGRKNQARRVHKQDVRDHFNLPDPRTRRPNFGQGRMVKFGR